MLKPEKPSDWAAERGEKWRVTLGGMEATLKPVDEPLIRALDLSAPFRIADIGCGGGATTFEILRRAPPGSVVHGHDISPTLIEAARERKRSNRSAVEFTIVDIESASAPKRLYDRVASRFGVMFYRHPHKAFSNVLAWLAPGGRVAFAVWDRPADNPWLFHVRDVVSKHADVPASGPDEPGPFRYGEVDTLLKLLDRVGYTDLEVRSWKGRFSIGGDLPPEEAANFALASFSSFGELLAQAGPEALEGARRSLTTKFSEHSEGGVVRLGASVHIVVGGKPG